MKLTKWHFELNDGKGGIVIYGGPVSKEQVIEDCQARFGEERLREVTHG